jgi:hypothetical protein
MLSAHYFAENNTDIFPEITCCHIETSGGADLVMKRQTIVVEYCRDTDWHKQKKIDPIESMQI